MCISLCTVLYLKYLQNVKAVLDTYTTVTYSFIMTDTLAPLFQQRVLAFSIYARCLNTNQVAQVLDISVLTIDAWRQADDWDTQIKQLFDRMIDPAREMAAAALFTRFREFNESLSDLFDRIGSSEDGDEAKAYADAITKLHDRQMTMMDKPTSIHETRQPHSLVDNLTDDQLKEMLALIEAGIDVK